MRAVLAIWILLCTFLAQTYPDSTLFTAYCSYNMLAQVTGTVLKWQVLEERGYHKQLDDELNNLVDQIDGVVDRCSYQLTHMPLREKVKHITLHLVQNL